MNVAGALNVTEMLHYSHDTPRTEKRPLTGQHVQNRATRNTAHAVAIDS